MTNTSQSTTTRRLGTLEQATAEMRAQQDAIKSDVHKLGLSLESLSADVRGYMQSAGRTNWSILAAFGGLILTVGALAASPFAATQRRLDDRLIEVRGRLDGVERSRWSRENQDEYAAAELQRFADVRALIAEALAAMREHSDKNGDKVDESLQREMRLLDDALQREMRMLLDAPLERLSALELRVGRVDEDLDAHTGNGHPNSVIERLAGVDDRVSHIERDLQSRAGARWNRADHLTEVAPMLSELRARINSLEIELARRATTVDRVEAEQRNYRGTDPKPGG